jgi:glycosyltransferase involved in cell wall biosynthesis
MEKSSLNRVKVSVCISVHNTAKYLPRCLDSVCAQTLDSLEIVLVNNGSTDNSEEIMHEYEKLHPERKFVIVKQEDRSLAGGRQTGIDHASGEYITFLDADDLVMPEAYEKMLHCIETQQVDIVEIETTRDGIIWSAPFNGKYDTHEILKYYFSHAGIRTMMLWLRLYKRCLFDKPVLPDLYTNNEDNFAFPCLLYAASTIYYLKEPLHTYSTDNESSVMNSYLTNPEVSEKFYNSKKKILLAPKHFEDFVGKRGIDEFRKEFDCYKAKYFSFFIFHNFLNKSKFDKEQAVIEAGGFSSIKEMHRFIRKKLPYMLNVFGLIKFIGLDLTYSLYYFKKMHHI